MARYDVIVLRKLVTVQRQKVSVQAGDKYEAQEFAAANTDEKRWINVRQLGYDYETEIKVRKG